MFSITNTVGLRGLPASWSGGPAGSSDSVGSIWCGAAVWCPVRDLFDRFFSVSGLRGWPRCGGSGAFPDVGGPDLFFSFGDSARDLGLRRVSFWSGVVLAGGDVAMGLFDFRGVLWILMICESYG